MGDYRQSYPQETRKILMNRFRVIGLATVFLAACSANTQEVADQTGLTFMPGDDPDMVSAARLSGLPDER